MNCLPSASATSRRDIIILLSLRLVYRSIEERHKEKMEHSQGGMVGGTVKRFVALLSVVVAVRNGRLQSYFISKRLLCLLVQ